MTNDAPVTPRAASVRYYPPDAHYEPFTRAWLDRINSCPYRECTRGCQGRKCHAIRDRFGELAIVSLADCRDCLRGTPVVV